MLRRVQLPLLGERIQVLLNKTKLIHVRGLLATLKASSRCKRLRLFTVDTACMNLVANALKMLDPDLGS